MLGLGEAAFSRKEKILAYILWEGREGWMVLSVARADGFVVCRARLVNLQDDGEKMVAEM